MSRIAAGLLIALTLIAGILIGGTLGSPSPSLSRSPDSALAGATSAPSATPSAPTASPAPTPTPTPSPTPSPTPVPTPVLVAAPLTGQLVTPALAQRHVVAVMIDDLAAARPQSGLSSADVVWQAPAEGGIPRYMALFQTGDPPAVGPVRSSRLYFIAWAAEWNAVYVHVGGSPQALALLHSSQGKGRVVFDADEFRWGGRYLWRIKTRLAPQNVYSDAAHLQSLARAVGAKTVDATPVWQFAPDADLAMRPKGGTITVPYLANRITYAYDRASNRYLRSVSVEGKQVDAGTNQRIGPKNVVVMAMSFAPLNDGTQKHRLEAQFTGSGVAYIATNGTTVKGTWKKKSMTAPTLFYGPDGKPVTLTIGQTFVQVVQRGTVITVKDGRIPPRPIRPAASGHVDPDGPLAQ